MADTKATDLDALSLEVRRLYEQGQFHDALKSAVRANALLSQMPGPSPQRVAVVLNNCAACHEALSDYPQAAELYQRSVEVLRTANELALLAATLTNLASVQKAMGRFSAALSVLREASQIQREALGETHPDLAYTLCRLGEVYQLQGSLHAALENFQQALRILERRHHGPTHAPDLAYTLGCLGEAYRLLDNLHASIETFQQALRILEQLHEPTHLNAAALCLNSLGLVYRELRRPTDATAAYKQALAILSNQSFPRGQALVLNNLAEVFRNGQRYEDARAYYEQAAEIFAKLGAKKEQADSLNNLGAVLREEGKFHHAAQVYAGALKIRAKVVGESHPDYAALLLNLATARAAAGTHNQALKLLERVNAYDNRILLKSLPGISERERLEAMAGLQPHCDIFLTVASRAPQTAGSARASYKLVLQRKGLAVDMAALQREALADSKDDAIRNLSSELRGLATAIAQILLAGPDSGDSECRDELVARQSQLQKELASRTPEAVWRELFSEDVVETVAKAIPPDAALVEYVRCETVDFRTMLRNDHKSVTRYLAFVVTGPESLQLVDLGEADPTDQLVAECKKELKLGADAHRRVSMGPTAEEKEPHASISAARRLCERIFDPLVPTLQGRRLLLIAGDGALRSVPFCSLLLDDKRRLIDDFCVGFLYTGRDLIWFARNAAGPSNPPVIVVNPDFDLRAQSVPKLHVQSPRPRLEWLGRRLLCFAPRSTFMGGESRELLAWGGTAMTGAGALEASLKAVHSPRILHLAVPIFALPASAATPVRVGLALAGANAWLEGAHVPPEAGDGLLTAEEVRGLDLRHTQLVVIAGANPELGGRTGSHAGLWLAQAFREAGARSVVLALWPVRDVVVVQFLMDFYRRLLAGYPRGDALRHAQLSIRATYPSASDWGTFICYGDPGPLSEASARKENATPVAAGPDAAGVEKVE